FGSGAGQDGTTVTVAIGGEVAGQQLYVKVAGAGSSPFGTGAYAMTLNFRTGPAPAVPLPSTPTPCGPVLTAGGRLPHSYHHQGQPDFIKADQEALQAQLLAGQAAALAAQANALLSQTAGLADDQAQPLRDQAHKFLDNAHQFTDQVRHFVHDV